MFRHLYPDWGGNLNGYFGYFQTHAQKVNEVRILAVRGHFFSNLNRSVFFNGLYLKL